MTPVEGVAEVEPSGAESLAELPDVVGRASNNCNVSHSFLLQAPVVVS